MEGAAEATAPGCAGYCAYVQQLDCIMKVIVTYMRSVEEAMLSWVCWKKVGEVG